jgi:polyphosphate kinase 2 (PPK2 family)
MNKPVKVRKADAASEKLSTKQYEKLLRELQVELCHLQDWVRESGERVIIVFEGRDTAGKGGLIKAIRSGSAPAPSASSR